jgi:quercetin dioxygenase-like cupin family protein
MPANAPKVLLRSEQSGGALSVIELTGSATPPLHRHDFDETFYVLEGELTFQLDEELVTRRAGELAFAPRGVPHTYANLSGATPAPCWSAPRPGSSATSTASPPRSPGTSRHPS